MDITTGAESSVVHCGRTAIPYRIRRSARRTTVAVNVAAGEGVTLSAPLGTPVERLDRVVHAKATWIVERLRHVGQVEDRVPERELVSGESYLYLGRHYRLSVVVAAAAQPGPVRLERGWLRVELPRAAADEHRAHPARPGRLVQATRPGPPARASSRLAHAPGRGHARGADPRPPQALGQLRRPRHPAPQLAHHPGPAAAGRLRGGARASSPRAPRSQPARVGLLG